MYDPDLIYANKRIQELTENRRDLQYRLDKLGIALWEIQEVCDNILIEDKRFQNKNTADFILLSETPDYKIYLRIKSYWHWYVGFFLGAIFCLIGWLYTKGIT